ncbi:hypothetical protein FB567DRAFT_353923 [Paraphoma chrysanthemicola]|uniref:Uncharacterized protein n=1 Tax=Paraphoma chrysanthemicola TaxID=798071 RepID=A0A8K0R961_9PLEO|nr:hypothetical protein FB567DRAFT_353923 [Paraphoma chrysanthemicola]
MPAANKRKSMLSPSPQPEEANSHRQRYSVQNAVRSSRFSILPPSEPPHQRFLDRRPRPKRWRGGPRKSDLSSDIPHKPFLQSIYEPQPSLQNFIERRSPNQQQDNAQVQFSFSSSAGFDHKEVKYPGLPSTRLQPGQEDINRSFEGLSFESGSTVVVSPLQVKPQRTGYGLSYNDSRLYSDLGRSPTPPRDSPDPDRTPTKSFYAPLLSKPMKMDYGGPFDSMEMYSDEYPDTECEWNAEPAEVVSPPRRKKARVTLSVKEALSTKTTRSKKPSTIIRQDTSFADAVVLRDVGSFHIAKPQKRLSCTTATREDTIRIKYMASQLLKYSESSTVCELLMARLERMVCAALKKPDRRGHNVAATATHCALKLRDHLVKGKEGRVETGELGKVVDHEIEWAKWLVEASCTGVMHLKVAGCECRPDWEEESEEEDSW